MTEKTGYYAIFVAMENRTFLKLKNTLYDLRSGLVMGILNLTPDSFYSKSRTLLADEALDKVRKMISAGAAIIDVGAFSSRPGAELPDAETEWNRLSPILRLLSREFPDLPVSLDTYRSEIARKAVKEYGVALINDISAGRYDPGMVPAIQELQVPIILMHMQENPANMQENPNYQDVVLEVIKFFSQRIAVFREAGIHDLVLDPGFGFGKNLYHNYQLLSNLDQIKLLGFPVLAGLSRKSMIYKSLNLKPETALSGTITLNALARFKGADILRVHDVKEAVECLQLTNQVLTPDLVS